MSSGVKASIGFEHWSDFFYQLGAICGPAELQGALVGVLAGGQRLSHSQWQVVARDFMDLPEPEVNPEKTGAINALYDLVLLALEDGDYQFRLLLPDDVLPLTPRIEALSQWCEGFLHGLGTAGEERLASLDTDSQEALEDIAQIAQLQINEKESEENEVYFAELVEYIRMAVLAIFDALAPQQDLPPTGADPSVAIH